LDVSGRLNGDNSSVRRSFSLSGGETTAEHKSCSH
jgi:hypothetical protein